MISFGIMTALLVAMASVVHFDLLGWFPVHPYGKHTMHVDDKQHRQPPTYEFDHMWIPRPGTDPSTFYLLPRTVVVNDDDDNDDDDGDDFWTDGDDSGNGTQSNRTTDGTHLDDEVYRQLLLSWSARDTGNRVPGSTIATVVPDDDRDFDDDDDYVAPGQEKDDDIF